MIEIRVNGKLLDIKGDDVTMQWQSFIFADAIGDQFSTDIELPRTDNNSRILQPFGLLDGVIDYNTRIRCSVSIDAIGCDGYLQVSALKRDTITAALFLSPFPYDLVDRKIRDIIHDTNYIREWDILSPTSYIGGHASGLQRSLFVNSSGSNALPWSLRLSEFLTALSTATGVSLNFPFSEVFRVVAATPKVSPFNTRQMVMTRIDETLAPPYTNTVFDNMCAGQHVCTDVKSPREVTRLITITRPCTATFDGGAQSTLYYTVGGVAYSQYQPSGLVVNFGKGDTFRLEVDYSPQQYRKASCLQVDYSNYATDDTDTDTLIFPGYVVFPGDSYQYSVPTYLYDSGTPQYNPLDGTGGNPRRSWSYMDFWWCLGNMTVREFINALCHIKGQPVSSTGTTLAFASPKEAEADGEITEIRTTSDKIGKVTKLAYNDKSVALPQTISFANQFLSDEATIFKSIFYGAAATQTGVAQVPLFEVEDAATAGFTWQDCGAVMLEEIQYTQGGSTYYALAPLGDQSWLGVDNITKPIEITFETYTDLRDIIYLYFEGRKYMVVTADTDTSTGLCQVTAILMT